MANDNHANYARVGFIVFIGAAAILGTLIYIGGLRGKGSEILVETCYDKPVSGLSVGSVVNLRGVKVGEVREIDIIGHKYKVSGEDNFRVYILMALERRIVDADSDDGIANGVAKFVDKFGLRATVTSSGVTGMSRMELDFNTVNPPIPPPISWTPEHPFIPPQVSLLENFSVAATKVMNQINKMDIGAVWSNINASAWSLAHATESAKAIIESNQGGINQLINNVTEITESAKDLVSELKRNPAMLIRERVAAPLEETAK